MSESRAEGWPQNPGTPRTSPMPAPEPATTIAATGPSDAKSGAASPRTFKSYLPKLREVIRGGITILVSVLLAWWGVASSQQIARDDDATQTAAQAEQIRQGETLERIEDTLQSLAGENPAPAQPTRDTPSGACTDDGTRFDGGWGPERPLFNDAVAPNYALMNSVLDNPNVGDERGFYGIKDAADTTPGGWRRSISVERDHTYVIRIYVRNDSAHPTADALNARFMVNLPTYEGTSIESAAFVTSSTAFGSAARVGDRG